MASVRYFICISLLCFIGIAGLSQTKQLDFFLSEGMKKSPAILEINNLQQNFDIQNQFITAQNKRPLISFTGDYLFAPFFFDDGKPISITSNPSPKAYGYDVGITNGGLYAAQLNASLPIFNTAIVKRLYEQNKVQADISANTRKQIEHELAKTITDQYIVTYQFQLQAVYLQKIIDQLENRKPLVAALVKQGLLQQNDYLLLDIQLSTNKNDLKQLEFAYNNGIALLKNLAFISDTTTFLLDKPNLIIDTATPDYYYVQKYKLDSLNLVAQLNVTNTKYLPQVSLMGSTGLNGTELTRLPHNVGLSAAVHVSIPISDGHQRKLYQRQNAILLANQQKYFNTAAIQQQNNLKAAKLQVDQWRQTVAMWIEPIQKQELLLDIIKDKVIKGQVTVMDYINALQDYAVMQKNRALAETNQQLYISQYNYYNW